MSANAPETDATAPRPSSSRDLARLPHEKLVATVAMRLGISL
ncbi:hypothetical protein AS850_14795 [Frondihabitans sp. 762G35]|nr:hypothetical protein [Frondihabitans sp. 762G35]ARC58351.1 hypothetical protein AS850_14795 [Frondihabitans sp. 762G35]